MIDDNMWNKQWHDKNIYLHGINATWNDLSNSESDI